MISVGEGKKLIQDKIESVIKLIRSKGVGIIFCTQTPEDISENVLGQLGLNFINDEPCILPS